MRLMTTCTSGLSASYPLNLLTDLVVEYVTIRSGSDMSFTWGASSQSAATELIARAHAAGARGMVSIWTQWDDSTKNIFGDATKRSNLINNILSLITATNSDGIYFNWESYSQSNWSNANWTTFIKELSARLPAGKVIQATSPSTKITVEAACVNDYYDTLYVNCYDVDPYPQEWYGSFEVFKQSLADYVSIGINKSKICGALNIAWRGASSGEDNWITWSEVLAGYKGSPVPTDNQNAVSSSTEWGYLYGCGYDLVTQKAAYVKDNKFAGMKMYMANIDSAGDKSQLRNISNVLNIDIEDPTGGNMVTFTGALKDASGNNISGKTLNFTVGSDSFTTTTGAGGFSVSREYSAGDHSVTVAFSGDASYKGSSATKSFTVTGEPIDTVIELTVTVN